LEAGYDIRTVQELLGHRRSRVAGLTPMAVAASMRFRPSFGGGSQLCFSMLPFNQDAWLINYTVEK